MMKHKPSAYASAERDGGAMPLLLPVLRALGIAAAAFAVLTLLSSLLAYSRDNPDAMLLPLGLAVAFVSALVCGFSAARLAGEKPAAAGLWAGGAYVLLVLLLRLIFTGGRESFSLLPSLGLYAALFGAVLLGALIGGRRPNPAKGRRKRLKKYAE